MKGVSLKDVGTIKKTESKPKKFNWWKSEPRQSSGFLGLELIT